MFTDTYGDIWAGTYGNGVLRINPETGNVQCIKKELHDGNVLNISGKNNDVWLATLGGATQITISGEELTIKSYSRNEGLSSEYIYQVFVDSKNRVWFGTDGKGADMFDHTGFHHYREGLNAKAIYGFTEDKNHDIWANVQGIGLAKFNGTGFKKANIDKRLENIEIGCLTSDQTGNLVLMHDLGIDVYDVSSCKLSHIGEQVGMHDKKPNLNACAKTKNGRILLGTDGGIIIYNYTNHNKFSSPQPVVEGLKVSNQNAEFSNNLNFKYNQNDITINYLGIWYQNTNNLNYLYKLDNYDNGWISSRNQSVTYSSLPPGEYTFRVKVSDSENFNYSKETSFSFIIHPPFWQTTWFYIFSFLFSVLAIWGYIKYRIQKLEAAKSVLEAKNDELKKTNMELDRFVYSVSHDLRAPLLSMQGVVEITQESTNEEMTKEHMAMLNSSITRLDNFIGEILDYSRNSRMEVKKDTIDFKTLSENITANLKYMGRESNPVKIQVDIKDNGMFCSDKGRLIVVLNNLVSNAIRYHNPKATTPYVKLEISADETMAFILVEDNGIGIPDEYHNKVFEMFYRVSENSVGSGLGLYIVKETVDRLNGNISVESQPGIGSKFKLSIPNLFYQ